MAAADCVFCRIVAGELPAHVVLEDDDFVAFLDTRPLFPGHVLLVPREHVVTIMDAPRGRCSGRSRSAPRTSRARVQAAMESAGIFTAANNVVSQSVPHLHVHVVPRDRKDGLRGFFWPRHDVRLRRGGGGGGGADPRGAGVGAWWPRLDAEIASSPAERGRRAISVRSGVPRRPCVGGLGPVR